MKKILKSLFWLFFPPITIWFLLTWDSLLKVINTGICPSNPPDGTPYPCTILEFLLRMTIAPYAFVGNVAIFILWLIALLIFIAIKKNFKSQ